MIITSKDDCENNRLYDYINPRGINIIRSWAMSFEKRERGRLDAKIDLLERVGDNLPPKLLHRIPRHRHIMHLVVKGGVTLCPLLCLGPINMQGEFTFLFGTTEQNGKLVQRDAPERAEQNRQDLISNPKSRCKHEQFGEKDKTNIQR